MLTVLGKTEMLRRDYSIFKNKKKLRGTHTQFSDHQTLSVCEWSKRKADHYLIVNNSTIEISLVLHL